uniref:Uncharacterized protein n=1 Tax=viral metagenome TaxID=1070528 RepID=A0A6M3IN57_9ZZZZ
MAFTANKDVSIGDATKETDHDNLSADQDWIQANADVDHDFDVTAAEGAAGDHRLSIAAPQHINVDNGSTVWSAGMWNSADTRWFHLGNTADVASFTRADADFYWVIGNILDVPLS